MQVKDLQRKRALRTALLVLLFSAVGLGKMYAYFEVDGIRYTIISTSPKRVGVSGKDLQLTNVIIPETVVYEGNVYSVTSILSSAFYNYNGQNLTSVSMPNSITEIQRRAFQGCTNLTSITIPPNVTIIKGLAFCNCTSLTTLNFNATHCMTMGESDPAYAFFLSVFRGCTSLTTINIGSNVQYIPNNAFEDCDSLTSVNITDIAAWCNIVFGPYNSNPLVHAHNLYLNGELLTELIIPSSITEIKDNAFYVATCLTSLTIPSSISSIGHNAFGCSGITTVYFNAINCSSIMYTSFMGCSSLTTVIFGDGVQTIPDNAFINNSSIETNITKVIIPNSVNSIGFCFNNCKIDTISIPSSVITLGSAFMDCASLKYVDFKATSCTSLNENSTPFFNCSNLTTISFNNDVRFIPNRTFQYCNSLTSLMIPPSIISIGNSAFMNCSGLNSIIALGTIPPALGENAFYEISPVATLFVPCGSQMTYFSNWNMFEYNNIHEDCTPRPVSISPNITGGTIIPSVSQATMGQEVILTVSPNTGMQLASITAYNTNNQSQIVPVSPFGNSYRFIMPPYAVTVSATFETCTSLEEDGIVSANVYPNPTNGHVKIETEDIRHIRINSMLGQAIYESVATGNEFEYDFSKHGEGVYLVLIETASGVVTKRVVVAR